jgi:acetyltransferase
VSVRNLEALFRPASVAVIGASDREGSVGALVMRNMKAAGFTGPLWPVNPKRASVAGMKCWPSVDALPAAPELAVICTPAPTVPKLIEQLGAKGTRGVVVLTAGLREPVRGGGRTLEQQMLDAARPYLLRILGPNCVGLLVPGLGLNASFAQAGAQPGRLAFVSQSGALATALLDWSNARNIGFSHFISMGDSADVDFGDVLDYLGSDPGTRAILMYMESASSARKFMSAARAAARNKPVLVVKAGRAPEGAKAAASHTGALAGSDDVIDTAFRRAGMLRVNTLADLFDAAETLARARALHGERLALVTNGGGAGVLAADALALGRGQLAQLSPQTLDALNQALPATWSHGNPVDIIGDAPVERYVAALKATLDDEGVDAVIFMHAPTAIVPSLDIARACLPLMREARKPVLTCWLGGESVRAAREACAEAGVPTYDTPERAVAAFSYMVNHRRNRHALIEVPRAVAEAVTPDLNAARQVIASVLASGRSELNELESKALLAAYGVPVVATRSVPDTEAAVRAAQEIGFPVALKILSPQISHKSDVGGVALTLLTPEAVRQAAEQMLERVAALRPDAHIDGFTVQAMVQRSRAHELIVGVATDPVFGPVILFGQGGTAVEVIKDRAMGLPPLNVNLAADMVSRTRISRLLAGYRDRGPAQMDAIHATLVKVSQMACDLPELAELDINPLLADEQGVIALDARVKLTAQPAPESRRLAIRPYPAQYEERIDLAGRAVTLRPIRPEDEPLLRSLYANANPDDMRLRFFLTRREVPRSELARYSQIDYDREMTFIAVDPALGADGLLGEVRTVCDPDLQRAEFSVQVRSGWQGQGLGRRLMDKAIGYLRAHGVQEVVGECLPANEGMSKLARGLGFAVSHPHDGESLGLHLALAGEGAAKR